MFDTLDIAWYVTHLCLDVLYYLFHAQGTMVKK